MATSFRRVGLGRLGSFVLQPEDLAGQELLKQAFGALELVYLATCNRVECYLLLPEETSEVALTAQAEAFFRARGAEINDDTFLVKQGLEAVRHALEVCSSLDSLIVGETQISGQARRAEERCRQTGLSGQTFELLFKRAVAAARRVRANTGIGSVPTSAASIAVQKIRKCFGAEGPAVAVLVGAGETTLKAAQAVAQKSGRRIFVNRTLEKAQELADRFGGEAMTLEQFRQHPPAEIDLVFAATAATEAVVPAAALAPALANRQARGERRPLVVCDLGLPRDVDPALDGREGVLVVHMGVIQRLVEANQASLQGEVVKARALLAEELAKLEREDRFRLLAGESATAMLAQSLAHLPEADREAILRFATGLGARIARQPVTLAG